MLIERRGGGFTGENQRSNASKKKKKGGVRGDKTKITHPESEPAWERWGEKVRVS